MPRDLDVTALLHAWSAGDADARERLLPFVYDDLRAAARRHLSGERANHTLSPTALVHEAYLRLVDQRRARFESRAQFFAIASSIMRRVLVDHARRKLAAKRGGAVGKLAITSDPPDGRAGVDVLALDGALDALERLDPRAAAVIELRFFAGLSVEEAAAALGVSRATVEREWTTARAWLFRRLTGDAGRGPAR